MLQRKRCTVCRREQPLAAFDPSGRSRDGLRAACRTCRPAPARVATPRRRAAPAPAAAVAVGRAAGGRRRASLSDVSRPPTTRAVDRTYMTKPAASGRQTQPANYNPFGLTGWYFIPKRQYSLIDVTSLDITQFSAEQMLALLPDLVPEVGKAVWNFLRTAAPDKCQFQALTLNKEEDPAGQAILDDLVGGVNAQWGGITAVMTQLLLSGYLQGAATCEAAPTKTLKDLDDLYVVNPDSIFFERDAEQRLVPYQRQFWWGMQAPAQAGGYMSSAISPVLQMGPFRRMNEETFFYNPVDPYVDDPYGRAPAAPALQVVFGLVQVLRDLGAVVHHQGWPKIDISLVWELMAQTIPQEIRDNEARKQQWLTAQMDGVIQAYNSMAPEDAFVHMDYVNVSSEKVAAGAKLFDAATVVHVFRIELIEALKSLPIFHSEHVGSTETYGSIEFEIYATSVGTIRSVASTPACRALQVGLQLRGHQGLVVADWPAVRTTQRLADAQAEGQEIVNAVNKRDQGFITQNDASREITGSDAVAPAPVAVPAPQGPVKPDPEELPPGTMSSPLAHARIGRGFAMATAAAVLRKQTERVLQEAGV